ncbi:MAG: universal stress protein [Dehalococcoidia bacterium]
MDTPTILVPLDGSELAEAALDVAEAFAKAIGARILLFAAFEDVAQGPLAENSRAAEYQQRGIDELRAYIAKMASELGRDGIHVDTKVVHGAASDEILRVIGDEDPSFVVLTTHGRSGISRWRYGSVASRLVHESSAATVVVGPNARHPRGAHAKPVRHILVPLDGSAQAEVALGPATELAKAFGAELVLAQVVQWPGSAYIAGAPELDFAQIEIELTEAAAEHLRMVRDRLAGRVAGRTVRTFVQRGPAVDALTSLVDGEGIDLVVMTSHCRTGFARAVLGSVADRMLQCNVPVVLIRPEGAVPTVHRPRGRYCHNCGRSSPYANVLEDDVCLRCGQHLHTCGNCAYFDGVACIMQRPEAHSLLPGSDCPYFQFRESEAPPVHSAIAAKRDDR